MKRKNLGKWWWIFLSEHGFMSREQRIETYYKAESQRIDKWRADEIYKVEEAASRKSPTLEINLIEDYKVIKREWAAKLTELNKLCHSAERRKELWVLIKAYEKRERELRVPKADGQGNAPSGIWVAFNSINR